MRIDESEKVKRMEELKKCMREAKKILDLTVGVMDTSGMVVACTDPAWEGIEDSSARAVLLSDEEEGKVLIARCIYEGEECSFDAVDDETADDIFAEFEAECPEFFNGEDGNDA